MSVDYVEILTDSIEHLPPLPSTINDLRALCNDPDSNYNDFVPIIERDPALCSDILHLANSAFFSLRHTVESVNDALRFIGMKSLVEYIAVTYVNKTIKKTFSDTNAIAEFFKHSQEVSLAVKLLINEIKLKNEEKDFFVITGLLHDLGRLLIYCVIDKEMRGSIGDGFNYPDNAIMHEEDILGVNHCFLGNQILKKWGFSNRMQDAVLHHHTPLKPDFSLDSAYLLIAHMLILKEIPDSMILGLFKDPYREKIHIDGDIISKVRKNF